MDVGTGGLPTSAQVPLGPPGGRGYPVQHAACTPARVPRYRSDKVDCLYMRIGRLARKPGVPGADIWHGVRNATHKIDMGEDLTMLIGPARDGAPLEIGVLGLDSDDPVIIHALPLRAQFYRFWR